MTEVDSTKCCRKCGEVKPRSAFSFKRDNCDGLNNLCRVCDKAKQKAWREANYERYMENRHKWVEEHREHLAEYQRQRYHDNLDAKHEERRRYRAEDVEAARQREREYYAKTKERRREQAREKYYRNRQDAQWVAKEWTRLNDRLHQRREQGGIGARQDRAEYANVLRGDPCSYCGECCAGSIDHVVPLKNGGEHGPDNLTAACRSCNSSKRDKSLLGFLLYRME